MSVLSHDDIWGQKAKPEATGRDWYDHYVAIPGSTLPRPGTDTPRPCLKPRHWYLLASLYRMVSTATWEVLATPERISQASQIPVATLDRLVGLYAYGKGKKSPLAPWITFVRKQERAPDPDDPTAWTVRWVLRLAPVPENDFIKIPFAMLWEQDSFEHRTYHQGWPLWTQHDPAILAYVAIARVGDDFKKTRKYGIAGLATVAGASDSAMEVGLSNAQENGWVQVIVRTKGGRGAFGKSEREVVHDYRPKKRKVCVTCDTDCGAVAIECDPTVSPEAVGSCPQPQGSSSQSQGGSPQGRGGSSHVQGDDSALTRNTHLSNSDKRSNDQNTDSPRDGGDRGRSHTTGAAMSAASAGFPRSGDFGQAVRLGVQQACGVLLESSEPLDYGLLMLHQVGYTTEEVIPCLADALISDAALAGDLERDQAVVVGLVHAS